MTLGALIDHVQTTLACDAADAFRVAQELYTTDEREYTEGAIRYCALKLGITKEAQDATTAAEAVARAHGELLTDPAEILAEVARVMPRVMTERMPVIGRRPKDHEISGELDRMLEEQGVPEEVRVCILDIDVFSGSATFYLYDEANDVDRAIGPLDLTRYEDATALRDALMTLMGRLPRVLAADTN